MSIVSPTRAPTVEDDALGGLAQRGVDVGHATDRDTGDVRRSPVAAPGDHRVLAGRDGGAVDELEVEAGVVADDAATAQEELVSVASADAARQSLEALTAAMAPAAAAAAATVPAGGRSLEDVVVDAMRPMLKQWLDANLPAMVESMVAREISRITGKRL